MSRYYSMSVTVRGFDEKKAGEIKKALEDEFDWEDMTAPDCKAIFYSGDGNLCGGESEDEFSESVAEAVHKADGKKCYVEVVCTCLEDIPCERYTFGDDPDDEG